MHIVLHKSLVQKGPRSLLLSLGVPSRPTPGSYPGPVQVPSRVRGGPVQIRHVLCFTMFRTHPGPEVGAIPAPSWSHPAPERSFQDRAWTGRNRLLGHFPCLGPIWSLGIARFTSWVAKAHRIADLHRAIWQN